MNWPRVGNPTRDAGIYPTLEIIIKCIYPLSARTLLAPILYYVLPNNEGWHTIAINPHDICNTSILATPTRDGIHTGDVPHSTFIDAKKGFGGGV